MMFLIVMFFKKQAISNEQQANELTNAESLSIAYCLLQIGLLPFLLNKKNPCIVL